MMKVDLKIFLVDIYLALASLYIYIYINILCTTLLTNKKNAARSNSNSLSISVKLDSASSELNKVEILEILYLMEEIQRRKIEMLEDTFYVWLFTHSLFITLWRYAK